MQTTSRGSSDRPGRGRRRRPRRRAPRARAAARRPPDPKLDLYYFDADAADRAVEFIERYLTHSKGEWAGQPLLLRPWQKDIVRQLFGWKRRGDGLRRYRTVYLEVPRKNGKSTFAAAIAECVLYIDGEPGAEVYSLAADREQAAIVFEQAKQMVQASPSLASRTEVYKRTLFVPATGSSYKVLSADVPSKHGLNPHGIFFDELHVQDDREMWDTMRTGLGARRQPVTIAMTTAGYDKKTICGELHDKAMAILDGTAVDDAFLPIVYGIRKGESWEDREVWRRVNPNLGISVKLDYLEQQYKEAKESPGFQNTFRRLHLNEWVQQAVRWIDLERWNECAGPDDYKAMRAALAGRPCYAALDLSTVTDLSALLFVFDSSVGPGEPDYPTEADVEAWKKDERIQDWEYGDPIPAYDALSFFWCPEEGIRQRSRKDRVSYDVWQREGALFATEGDAVDHGAIRKFINDMGREFLIQEIAVDAWNAHKLITELEQEDGFTVVRMSQGFGAMSAPTKALDVLYRRRQLRHGGHPVLAWNADNVTLDKDAYDNWKPSKKRSRERIDGIVALVMALARAQVSTGAVEDGRIEPL
jgi:phage terminase large subunit-like protein